MDTETTLSLSTVLNADTFSSLTDALSIPADAGREYIDDTKRHKGMTVVYHAGHYKKKVSVLFDLPTLLPYARTFESLPKKVHKRLRKYFGNQLGQLRFLFSSASIAVNLDLGSHDTVADYLTVLRRIGRVKGYTLKSDCGIGGTPSYLNWVGNSNAAALCLYGSRTTQGEAGGILRAEVQLRKSKAVCRNTKTTDPEKQIIEVAEKAEKIFLRVFAAVIPYGAFLKQRDAVRLIQAKVSDVRLREKMWRLVALIPTKKSLFGALKAAGCRNTHGLLDAFADIDLSPITISKRHHCPQLANIYDLILK